MREREREEDFFILLIIHNDYSIRIKFDFLIIKQNIKHGHGYKTI